MEEYKMFTKSTNCYPDFFSGQMIDVLLIGLCEEITEFLMSELDRKGEAGDMLWYAVEISRNISMDDAIFFRNGKKNLMEILKYALSTVKKNIRGDFGELEKNKRCGEIVYWIIKALENEGFHINDLIESNTKKLTDRKERGVIKGEGDNR